MQTLRRLGVLVLLAAACGQNEGPPPAAGSRATVVHATEAEKGDVYEWVYGQGTALAVRRKALYFQLDGRISYIARAPDGGELRLGDSVKGPEDEEILGQLLAKVDDRDVLANVEASRAELRRTQTQRVSSEAQLKSAKAELEAAQREQKRMKQLVESGAGNQADLDNAETRVKTANASVDSAKSQLSASASGTKAQAAQVKRSEVAQERAAIFAPFDGVVAALNVKEGDYYFGAQVSNDPGQQLRTAPIVVIDPSEFELQLELPEYEAAKVKVGMTAAVLTGEDVATLAAASDPSQRPEALLTRGTVFSVSPSVDPSARSVQVKVRVTERPERLRDGEFASCFIMTRHAADTVAIPYEAFIREDDHAFAFVAPKEGGPVERRDLQIGLTGVGRIEVKSGLTAGELVVTRGRRSLGDGSVVDVAEIESTPNEGAPDIRTEDGGAN